MGGGLAARAGVLVAQGETHSRCLKACPAAACCGAQGAPGGWPVFIAMASQAALGGQSFLCQSESLPDNRVCFLTRHLLRGQLRGLKVSGITRAVLWQSCVLTLSISLVGMMSALTNPICLPLCCLLQLSSPFLLDPELGIGIFQ